MVGTLVEANINLENKGGQWLLCILEEAKVAQEKMQKFSTRSYFKSLHMSENDIKAAYQNIDRELKMSGYTAGLRQFILDHI